MEERTTAFKQMEQEKQERERKLELQREYEAHQRRQREQLQEKLRQKRAPQAKFVPSVRPNLKRKLENRPFEPVNEAEEILLEEYSQRAAPESALPKVNLTKRNGVYWLGQRRFTVTYDGSAVIVEPVQEPFSEWVVKAERIEGLRLKGLQSAAVALQYA